METKICTSCGKDLPLYLFYTRLAKPTPNCKDCTKKQRKEFYIKNKSKIRAKQKEYYSENLDYFKDKNKKYRENNEEKLKKYNREYCKKHYEDNKEDYLFKTSSRKAKRLQAEPDWLEENHKKEIREKYKASKKLSKETGVTYHVDHIIPLQGKYICGLHVPWNLQVITAEENLAKGNKFKP